MVQDSNKKRIVRVALLSAVILFVGFLVSQSIGLGATGFESERVLQQFTFYLAGIGFLVGILTLFLVELVITEKDERYGNSLAYNSPGEIIPIKARFIRNPFRLALLSVVVFGLLGIFSTALFAQTTFTGVGVLEQQFSETQSILFSSALVPASENLGVAFVIAFTIFSLRWFARRRNLPKQSFIILSVFLPTIMAGIYGLINHLLRYSDSEVSLIAVILFWTVGGLITAVSGSFIPFWIMHIINNLVFDLSRSFSNDGVVLIMIVILVFSIIAFAFTFIGGRKDGR